jgi:WD40 repeat protein
VRLWDRTGQLIGDPLSGRSGAVFSVAFSPDGTRLASADDDVRLWDVSTRKPIGQPLTGHIGGVLSVAFSPDGTVLASASYDGTVRLWDVSTRRPIGDPLTGHTDNVYKVAFSPDGTRLASASHDGTVRLWDRLWDVGEACELAAQYVTRAQVQSHMPFGWKLACQYAE